MLLISAEELYDSSSPNLRNTEALRDTKNEIVFRFGQGHGVREGKKRQIIMSAAVCT